MNIMFFPVSDSTLCIISSIYDNTFIEFPFSFFLEDYFIEILEPYQEHLAFVSL